MLCNTSFLGLLHCNGFASPQPARLPAPGWSVSGVVRCLWPRKGVWQVVAPPACFCPLLIRQQKSSANPLLQFPRQGRAPISLRPATRFRGEVFTMQHYLLNSSFLPGRQAAPLTSADPEAFAAQTHCACKLSIGAMGLVSNQTQFDEMLRRLLQLRAPKENLVCPCEKPTQRVCCQRTSSTWFSWSAGWSSPSPSKSKWSHWI